MAQKPATVNILIFVGEYMNWMHENRRKHDLMEGVEDDGGKKYKENGLHRSEGDDLKDSGPLSFNLN